MRLLLKKLKGPECSVDVSPNADVSELKQMASRLLGIPPELTKLVYKGKTLSDDKSITSYNITQDTKVFVVEKKGAEELNGTASKIPDFWTQLQQFLQQHYTEEDAPLVLEEFKKRFTKDMSSLSLDDIERLAKINLEAQKPKT